MSRLELDDQILNHDKFIRARKLGGSEAIDLWLGIRAYCGQRLSDGFVPSDMLSEVRGPLNEKKRAAALKVLVDVRLLDPCDGGFQMHDYLDWSRSKSQVLADRARARERQAQSRTKSHGKSRRDTQRDEHSNAPDPSGSVTKASSSASTSSSATTPKPPQSPPPDPDARVPCPVPLPLDDDAFAQLAELRIDRPVAEAFLRQWAGDQKAAKSNPRPVGAWVICGLKALRGQWSDGSKRAEIRALAATPEPEPSAPRVRTIDDVMAEEGAA